MPRPKLPRLALGRLRLPSRTQHPHLTRGIHTGCLANVDRYATGTHSMDEAAEPVKARGDTGTPKLGGTGFFCSRDRDDGQEVKAA